MDAKDYLLLEYLNVFDKPIELKEDQVSHEIKVNFQFYGLDKYKYPDSIYVRLFELTKFKLVKQTYVKRYEITEIGREELKSYTSKKRKSMVTEETLLRYFYKQNKSLTLDDLFEKFGVDDSILRPANYLVDNDWLEDTDRRNLARKITEDGKKEFERREKINNPQPTQVFSINNGSGIVINTGTIEGNIKNNVSDLSSAGLTQMSKAIQDLVESVKNSSELLEQQKSDYLELLKTLSEQALKPKEERLPTSAIKQIIKFGLGSLEAFSSISTISGISIKNIVDYFTNEQ